MSCHKTYDSCRLDNATVIHFSGILTIEKISETPQFAPSSPVPPIVFTCPLQIGGGGTGKLGGHGPPRGGAHGQTWGIPRFLYMVTGQGPFNKKIYCAGECTGSHFSFIYQWHHWLIDWLTDAKVGTHCTLCSTRNKIRGLETD